MESWLLLELCSTRTVTVEKKWVSIGYDFIVVQEPIRPP
jgi:hypothetical protein